MTIKHKKKIRKEKVWVDTDTVNTNYRHGINWIEYKLYNSETGHKHINYTKNICLAGFNNLLKNKHNRFLITIYIYKSNKPRYSEKWVNVMGGPVTEAQSNRWISLCKRHKLLPPYVPVNAVKFADEKEMNLNNGGSEMVIGIGTMDLDISNMSPAQLYLYVASFRDLREEPGFVKCVIHLVDKCKMNFYAAYIFATIITNPAGGHHPLDTYKLGSRKVNIDDVEVDIAWPMKLKKFAYNPNKYDTRNIYGGHYFNANVLISDISAAGMHKFLKFQEFFNSDVVRAIMAKTDNKSKEYLNRFLGKRERIVYEYIKKEKDNSCCG